MGRDIVHIGIDPGSANAAIASIRNREDGTVVYTARKAPTIKLKKKLYLDMYGICNILTDMLINAYKASCVVEKVGPMPKQGISSAFNFGKGTGLLTGMIMGMGISMQEVPAVTWVQKMCAGIPKGAPSKTGRDKNVSLYAVRTRMPAAAHLTERPKLVGTGVVLLPDVAEALLMAKYAELYIPAEYIKIRKGRVRL